MTAEQKVNGRLIGVLGMARSGMAVVRLAHRYGARLFVSDAAPAESVKPQLDELSRLGVPFETGGHTDRLLECDYLVLSPGVPLTLDIIGKAQEKGVPYFSELEFASWFCRGRIAAITGSNGKTTTTTLIGEMLTEGGLNTHVCGNIGRPFAEAVELVPDDGVAVVEVSTFQLETISDFHPDVAVILNLSPDHLDRHGSFETYKSLKYRITENQTSNDQFVLNRGDAELTADNPASKAKRLFFSVGGPNGVVSFVEENQLWVKIGSTASPIIPVDKILIPGPHNLQNAAAAAVVATLFDIDRKAIAQVLRTFQGVEHRLEPIGLVAGVRFVNDSKATNVDSVCYALKSIREPLYLICGGRDKGSGYEPIIETGRGKIKGLIIIGEARDKIFASLGKHFPSQFAESMEQAVEIAFDLARPGEAVLLSPGCASFDMFDNFEQRGRAFKDAVKGLRNNSSSNETVTG